MPVCVPMISQPLLPASLTICSCSLGKSWFNDKKIDIFIIFKSIHHLTHLSPVYLPAVSRQARWTATVPQSPATGAKWAGKLPECPGGGPDLAALRGGRLASTATHLFFCRRSQRAVSHPWGNLLVCVLKLLRWKQMSVLMILLVSGHIFLSWWCVVWKNWH